MKIKNIDPRILYPAVAVALIIALYGLIKMLGALISSVFIVGLVAFGAYHLIRAMRPTYR